MRNLLLILILVIAVAVTFWLLPQARPGAGIAGEAGTSVHSSGQATIGGPFILTDQHGVVRKDTDFNGQYRLVYFGFTYCPDICPMALLTITNALNRMGSAGDKITPIFITLDPERDTSSKLEIYVSNFHPRMVALTGTSEQIKAAADAYKIYFAKTAQEGSDSYTIDHSGFIYLMGPDGHYLAHFPHDVPEATLVEKLQSQVR